MRIANVSITGPNSTPAGVRTYDAALGRHHVGSSFSWYLRDPAGNFSEYYSDLDCIVDDALWTPRTWEGARPVQLGPATTAVVPGPRGPGGPHDRRARRELMTATDCG